MWRYAASRIVTLTADIIRKVHPQRDTVRAPFLPKAVERYNSPCSIHYVTKVLMLRSDGYSDAKRPADLAW